MKKLFFLFVAVTLLAACGGGEADTTQQLEAKYQEVDSLHNEAMAMGMGKFQAYETQLEKLLKAAEEDETVLNGQSKETVNTVLEQMEGAYRGMMTWMKDHKTLEELEAEGLSFDDKIAHLTTDFQAIQKVNDETSNVVKVAEELMEKLGLEVKKDSHEGHDHGHDHDHSHDDHEGHDH